MGALLQTAFACGCGSDDLQASGFCRRCDRRARLNRENFDGLRESVLVRDDRQCRTCGERTPAKIVVHHRRPGLNLLQWLITLCRGCHVRVHLTPAAVGFCYSGLLRALWLEMYDGPKQRAFRFPSPTRRPVQVELFQTAAGVWTPIDSARVLLPAAPEIVVPGPLARAAAASA